MGEWGTWARHYIHPFKFGSEKMSSVKVKGVGWFGRNMRGLSASPTVLWLLMEETVLRLFLFVFALFIEDNYGEHH